MSLIMKREKATGVPTELWIDLYELTMAQAYFLHRPRQYASFELFIRSPRRPFYLACGIDEAVEYALNLRFSPQATGYLRSLKIFRKDFLEFLRSFRFRGNIYGVREGEIVFANEPLMRIEANIIEAQLLESAFLNIINLNTTLATKSLRVVLAAGGKPVYDFSLRRTQGLDASLAVARNSFLAGAKGTSNVLAGLLFHIPVVGTMAHSFVMSFKEELDSFRTFWEVFPKSTILLIDTYSVRKGIDDVIRLARFLQERRGKILGVRIDSGDIRKEARDIRHRLDKAGLNNTIIVASGDLDEYKIKALLRTNAPIDAFGVGTKMGTSADVPFTDVVYKIVEVSLLRGNRLPLMKLSENKTILPGRKKISRKFSSQGYMQYDYLASIQEQVGGRILLRRLVREGKKVYTPQTLRALRKEVERKIRTLPASLKDLQEYPPYQVKISKGLKKLSRRIAQEINRQISKPSLLFFDIDTQYDFVSPRGKLYVPGAEKFKGKWGFLTRLAQKKKVPILASLDSHVQNDKEFRQFPPHCIRGSRGERKISSTLIKSYFILDSKPYSLSELLAVKERYDQIIIRKPTFSVFSNPNTALLLDMYMPEEIYLYGLAAEFCVKAALEGLLKRGERVWVVEDAVVAIEKQKAEFIFQQLKKKGVKFVTVSEVRDRLNKEYI